MTLRYSSLRFLEIGPPRGPQVVIGEKPRAPVRKIFLIRACLNPELHLQDSEQQKKRFLLRVSQPLLAGITSAR